MGKEQKKMFVMMGIQGSGKSTFCARFLTDAVRVNLDTLHTRNKEALLIAECLEKGCDFVVDNTNPTREDRARYIPKAKEAGYHVTGYFMQSCIQDCIQRNAQREGKARVPNGAIAMTSNKLEMPSYEEGFDELYFVKNENDNMEICEWRNEDEL
ncbi:MAG: AAA family ATPase [Lachnospiraceae bacterium]|nr:AAA family ATPase [Lachnospiraceae bacterium]MBP3296030.1 AAA family ATPase [Lachnospiraceae bacterium]